MLISFLKGVVAEFWCISRGHHTPQQGDESAFLDEIETAMKREFTKCGTIPHAEISKYTVCEKCGNMLAMTYDTDDPGSYWISGP